MYRKGEMCMVSVGSIIKLVRVLFKVVVLHKVDPDMVVGIPPCVTNERARESVR